MQSASCDKVFIFKRNDAIQNTRYELLPHYPIHQTWLRLTSYLFPKPNKFMKGHNLLMTKTPAQQMIINSSTTESEF